jgi:hypothetical protein
MVRQNRRLPWVQGVLTLLTTYTGTIVYRYTRLPGVLTIGMIEGYWVNQL